MRPTQMAKSYQKMDTDFNAHTSSVKLMPNSSSAANRPKTGKTDKSAFDLRTLNLGALA